MAKAPLHIKMAVPPVGGTAQFVIAKDGTKIRFAHWDGGDKGMVLLLSGRTEFIEKYSETIKNLTLRGFNVVTLDWRGQGLSDHIDGLTDRGDVLDFSNYQQDIEAVLNHPDIVGYTSPKFLFSHSMGGCISLRHLMNKHDFKAAVFSAPMWGIDVPPLKFKALALVSKLFTRMGKGQKHAPTQNSDFYVLKSPFEGNDLTTDPAQFQFFKELVATYPAFGLGGPTMRWSHGAVGEFKHFKQAKLPEIPMLVLLGTEECVVSPDAIHQLCDKMPNATLKIIEGARHEIWMETEALQKQAWAATDAFLDKLS